MLENIVRFISILCCETLSLFLTKNHDLIRCKVLECFAVFGQPGKEALRPSYIFRGNTPPFASKSSIAGDNWAMAGLFAVAKDSALDLIYSGPLKRIGSMQIKKRRSADTRQSANETPEGSKRAAVDRPI